MNEEIKDLIRAINNLAKVNSQHVELAKEGIKIQREMMDFQKQVQDEEREKFEDKKEMLKTAEEISKGYGDLKNIDIDTFKNIADAAKYHMDKHKEEDEEFKKRIHPKG